MEVVGQICSHLPDVCILHKQEDTETVMDEHGFCSFVCHCCRKQASVPFYLCSEVLSKVGILTVNDGKKTM